MKFKTVEAYYEELRRADSARRNAVLSEMRKDTAFSLAEDAARKETVLLARAEFDGNAAAAKTHEAALSRAECEMEDRLQSLGFTKDALLPRYFCPLCKDTGYLLEKPCSCMEKVRKILLLSSGVTKDFPAFGSSDPKIPALASLTGKIRAFADKFPDTTVKNLVFYGKTGTGKTHLTQCFCRAEEERGFSVYYATALELNETFLRYHTGKSDSRTDDMEKLLSADVLAIDDLGTEPVLKNVTKEYLLSVVSTRTLRKKHTVITTNLEPKDFLLRYEERLFSRLADKRNSRWIAFSDIPDLRLKK